MRIGLSALRNDFTRPDARRRFCHYAKKRGLAYEAAVPEGRYDLVVSTMGGDLSVWSKLPPETKLVLDFVDSYFAIPREDWRARARGVIKYAIGHTKELHLDYRALMEAACRRADAVVCCTEAQRESILPFCSNVHPILDFQPETEFAVKTDYKAGEPFHLVWEGLPQNLAEFTVIADVLRALKTRRKITLHLVTDLELARVSTDVLKQPTQNYVKKLLGFGDVFLYQWNHRTLSAIATACDLAIIPLRLDDAFAAGKSENKLILFWRMGVPVVTSATPAYRRAMTGAGLDWTCTTADDWARTLERAMDDEAARRAAGERGRRFALAEHGEDRLVGRWDRALASVGAFEAAR
jgi:glycosyltransferase involved in cell wall biosynthesis